jgi:hypothetical protein
MAADITMVRSRSSGQCKQSRQQKRSAQVHGEGVIHFRVGNFVSEFADKDTSVVLPTNSRTVLRWHYNRDNNELVEFSVWHHNIKK